MPEEGHRTAPDLLAGLPLVRDVHRLEGVLDGGLVAEDGHSWSGYGAVLPDCAWVATPAKAALGV